MNLYGHCTACTQPILDESGAPRPDAWLLTLVQVGGEQLNVTVCEPCRELASGRLGNLWHRICEQEGRVGLDNEYRVERGGKPLDETQREQRRESLRRLVANPPLGILSRRPWKEIHDGRSA